MAKRWTNQHLNKPALERSGGAMFGDDPAPELMAIN